MVGASVRIPFNRSPGSRESRGIPLAPARRASRQDETTNEPRRSHGHLSRDDPKPKPDFSNVTSGSSSTAPETPAPAEKADASTTYTVVSGDSLSKIAKREYGSAQKWRVIFEANRDVIKDPDLIYPGQVLKIPAV